MKFKEYVDATEETAIYPKERELEYLTLGLLSETMELQEPVYAITYSPLRDQVNALNEELDSLKAELGDCFWYCARLSKVLDMPTESMGGVIDSYGPLDHIVDRLMFPAVGRLAGYVKKLIRDSSTIDIPADKKSGMQIALAQYFDDALSLTCTAELLFEEVLDANIKKLRGRKRRGTLSGSGDNR